MIKIKDLFGWLLPMATMRFSLDMGAPEAPDPNQTAAAQGKYNADAARLSATLNRPDQITPYGTLKWTNNGGFDQAGFDAAMATYNQAQADYTKNLAEWQKTAATSTGEGTSGGFPGFTSSSQSMPGMPTAPLAPTREAFTKNGDNWTSTITLDPKVQAIMEAQLAGSAGLQTIANNQLTSVGATLANPISVTNQDPRMTATGAMNAVFPYIYDPRKLYTNAEGLQKELSGMLPSAMEAWKARGDMPTAAPVQGLEKFQGAQGPRPEYQATPGAAPTFTGQTSPVPTSDEAYRRQIQDALYGQMQSRLDPRFGQRQSDLDTQLATQGITQGSEAYNREQMNLARERTDAYQQAMSNAITGGEAAVAGQYGRDITGRQLTDAELQQQFTNDLTSRRQTVAEALQNFQAGLAGRQQEVGEASTGYQADIAKRAQDMLASNQGFQQSLASRQLTNAELSQALQAAMAGTNAVQGAAGAGADLANAGLGAAQSYGNLFANARMGDLQEQQAIRGQILNELSALRTGSQVAMPQFGSGNVGANVAPAPYASLAQNQYNAQTGSYNNMLGGLTSLGGAALMSPAGTFSGLFGGSAAAAGAGATLGDLAPLILMA